MGDDPLHENRLIDIETKLAHQELLVDELNGIVTGQQRRIDTLEARCQALLERLRSLGDGGGAGTGSPDEERPPHY